MRLFVNRVIIPVMLGPAQGDLTTIVKGVSAGDRVVTDGLDKLQPGTRVVVQMDSNSGAGAAIGG